MSIPITFSKSIWLPFALCLVMTSLGVSFVTAQEIQWRQDLDLAKAEALKTNRLVWVHFSADWCVPCKRLDTFVFNDTSLIRAADRNTVAVRIDADTNDSLVRAFDVPRIPYDIVMTPGGEVIINRRSPSRVADYLKMINGLDAPLQALNSGERELINARIGKIQRFVQKAGGGRQKSSDLDLDAPSHEMAATTVEGQRLERGFESEKRTSKIRAIQARLLKQKAELVYAQEVQKQSSDSGPKITENPFFKSAGSDTKPASVPSSVALLSKNDVVPTARSPLTMGGSDPQSAIAPKVSINQFARKQEPVAQLNPAAADPNVMPPLPTPFKGKTSQHGVGEVAEKVPAYKDREGFSFHEIASVKGPVSTGPVETATEDAQDDTIVARPKFSLPKLAAEKPALPKLSEFDDRLSKEPAGKDFAYAPISDLRTALKSVPKPKAVEQKKPGFDVAGSQRPMSVSKPSFSQQKPAAKKRTIPFPSSKPVMKTAVSVPQPPVMVEGVVEIAETMIPTVEGRLVSGEEDSKSDHSNGNRYSQQPAPQKVSKTERLLQQVNYFEAGNSVKSVPQKTAPQPQVLINLNTGASSNSQAVQGKSHGRIIQPGIAGTTQQSTVSTAVTNRATSNAVAASRNKYVLKGKCPVTLLTEGRWVDGLKQFGCVHRDRVYLFTSSAKRDIFLANPDQMSPLLAGFDPVIYEETGKLVDGEEKFGTFMGEMPNRRIVLFKTADTRARFQNEPVKYLNVIRNAMTKNASKDTKLR